MNLYEVETWEEKIYRKTILVFADNIEEATEKGESGCGIMQDDNYRETTDAGHINTKLILKGKDDERSN